MNVSTLPTKRALWLGVALFAVSWLATTTASAQPPCRDDASCREGQNCADGECRGAPDETVVPTPTPVDPAPPPPPPPPAPVPDAGAALLGGPGESCRARADCQRGLKCLAQVCVDRRHGTTCNSSRDCGPVLECRSNVCVNPGETVSADGRIASGDGHEEGGGSVREGLHAFIGVDFAGGPSLPFDYELEDTGDVEGSFFFAIDLGMTFGPGVLGLEFSPVTFMPYTVEGADPNLSMLGYIGGRFPLGGDFHYSMRFGLGLVAVNTLNEEILFQQRADLLGFGFNVDHIFFDFHLPSFRHITDLEFGSVFLWQPGMAASYVF